MEKVERISIDDFMSMFIAVSFLQEQRIFSIESLKNYLRNFYNVSDETIDELDKIIIKMEEAKMLSKIPNHDSLYRIGKNIPFERIVSSNYEYADGIRDFFYDYISCSIPNVKLISEQSEYTKQKK